MNFANLINQKIITKNKEIGTIVCANEQYLSMKIDNITKDYSTKVCLSSGYITITNQTLQQEIEKWVSEENLKHEKEEAAKKKREEEATQARIKLKKEYEKDFARRLSYRSLFGSMIEYPRMKKYSSIILEDLGDDIQKYQLTGWAGYNNFFMNILYD